MEKLKDINQLEKEVTNLNQIINEYTLLRGDTDNIGLKKSCEFFVNHMVKKKLSRVLSLYEGEDLGSKSCEQIAEEIGSYFEDVKSVQVWEDGENGAEVEYD